jgi:hypothetical protein
MPTFDSKTPKAIFHKSQFHLSLKQCALQLIGYSIAGPKPLMFRLAKIEPVSFLKGHLHSTIHFL